MRQRQHQLTVVVLGRHGDVVLDATTQHHHTARLGPAAQADLVLDRLPALAGLTRAAPILAPEQPLDQALDVGRLAQPQQVRQPALLAHIDDVLVAIAAIAAHQRRCALAQLVEQPHQRRLCMPRRVLLARGEHRILTARSLPRFLRAGLDRR